MSPALQGRFLTTGPPGKSLAYPEWKSSGVLGLPPDDGCDPSDEQQQHSHCCEHGVSREHLAGPLGQAQAQDYQQKNCKGQGGEQAGPRRQRCQDLGSHPSPGCPHQEGPSYLQDSSTDKIHTPVPSCQFQNTTKKKSHWSPNRKAYPLTIWPDFWVGMVLVGNHRLFRMFEFPASDTGSGGFFFDFRLHLNFLLCSLLLAAILIWLVPE